MPGLSVFLKAFCVLCLLPILVVRAHLFKAKNIRRAVSTLGVSLAIATSPALNVPVATAAVTDDTEGVDRFLKVKSDLTELNQQWDDIATKGGDEIRRKLGTVYGGEKGCSVSLCGYRQFQERFLITHLDEIDFDELEEPAKDLLDALNQADFLAYSANFAEYGNGGGRASEYIGMCV